MKEELRNTARKNRDKIGDPQKASALSLRDNFIRNIDLKVASTIGCYWPIGSEIDVRPLITKLYEEGHNICLPGIVEENAPLVFREWEPGAVLVKSKFKIYEPCAKQHRESVPDVLVTPLLAFDHFRHRLGYGGGYYDRTIDKFKKDGLQLVTIGVAYGAQQVEKIPNEDWDVQLDKIVTETKVFSR